MSQSQLERGENDAIRAVKTEARAVGPPKDQPPLLGFGWNAGRRRQGNPGSGRNQVTRRELT